MLLINNENSIMQQKNLIGLSVVIRDELFCIRVYWYSIKTLLKSWHHLVSQPKSKQHTDEISENETRFIVHIK